MYQLFVIAALFFIALSYAVGFWFGYKISEKKIIDYLTMKGK